MKKYILLFLALTISALADSITINVGEPVTFSVTTDGTPPFSYQWSYMPAGGNAVIIQGATGASYRIPLAKATDTGNYFVTVQNAWGSTVSDLATLTVKASGLPPTKAVTKSVKQ